MNHDFSGFPQASFPVYTLSRDHHKSACRGAGAPAAVPTGRRSSPPERPQAGPGVDRHALGIIVRPDGTHQVTYNGRPLYLFYDDAYIPGLPYNGGHGQHQRSGCAHPVGRVQHDPAVVLEPRRSAGTESPARLSSTGALARRTGTSDSERGRPPLRLAAPNSAGGVLRSAKAPYPPHVPESKSC